MNDAVIYLLKVTLCSGALFAYYLLALRNRIFHQWNRFYLLAATVFSLLFPLIPMPQFYEYTTAKTPITFYELLSIGGVETETSLQSSSPINWSQFFQGLYLVISTWMLFTICRGLAQLHRMLRQSKVQQLDSIFFVTTTHPAAPFSFFNWLFWKNSLPLDSPGGQSVFRHELVHIQQHHSLDKLLVQIVLVFFWINPFFWLMRRELQMIHEFIADKKAVGNAGTEALAAMMLQSVYGTNATPLINPFFQQPIKRRLAMLQKTLKAPRNAYLGRILSLPLCAVLLFAFSKNKTKIDEHSVVSKATPNVSSNAGEHATINIGINSKGMQENIGTNQNDASLKLSAAVIADTIPKKSVDDDIKEVHINKKDKVKTITITYKNGKKETLTEQQAKERGLLNPPPPPPVPGTTPPPPPPPPMDDRVLVVVDGKEKGTLATTGKLDDLYKPEDIESINVLKNKSATEKYGEKGKYGVIEINLKKPGASKQE